MTALLGCVSRNGSCSARVFVPSIVSRLLLLSHLFCLGCSVARAQAAAEAAAATSAASATAVTPKPSPWSAVTPPDNKGKSPHLPATSGASPEAANRQALEAKAGKDAGKLLIRSVPKGAQVWIDGAFVGNSPMLLILAPGKYHLELRGQRMEYGSQVVGLLPRETREVSVTLAVRYPTRASVH